MNVDVYMLDYNKRRPGGPNASQQACEAAASGRYEYSFTMQVPRLASNSASLRDDLVGAAESAYLAQGNNFQVHKVRRDRQTMSTGDVVIIDGRHAMLCVSAGFREVPELLSLQARIEASIEASWHRWTEVG